MDYQHELNVALAAAKSACAIQLDARRDRLGIERKADASPVTEIDRHCERVIRDTIEKAFPDDGFLGEECGMHEGGSGRTWVVDPLDGTRPFIRGIPTYSSLVALEIGTQPVVGVMVLPALNITYWASRGGGACKNGEPIHVSGTAQLGQVTGSGLGYIQKAGTPRAQALLALMQQWDCAYGFMDAFTYGLIAEGALDVCVNLLDRPWDCAAAACIVTEAGGRFSDLDGNPSVYNGGIIISNGLVHGAVLDALSPGL